MKAVLRFLLNTGAGRMIVQSIVRFLIKLIKKKIERLEPYKAANINSALDLVDAELHADLESGNLKPTDML